VVSLSWVRRIPALPPSSGPGQGEAIAVLGRIITASVARVRDIDADEYWLIARAGPDVPPLVRHAELAPSEALFRTYLAQWRGCPGEQWWPHYSSAFSREMETEEKVAGLRALVRAAEAGKTVALFCFCPDPRFCHRQLVGAYLRARGVGVEEWSSATSSQLAIAFPAG